MTEGHGRVGPGGAGRGTPLPGSRGKTALITAQMREDIPISGKEWKQCLTLVYVEPAPGTHFWVLSSHVCSRPVVAQVSVREHCAPAQGHNEHPMQSEIL
jgi:hypothetical protein